MLNKSTPFKTGLYWFTNDLRLDDNAALKRACLACDHLLCIYIVDPAWFKPNVYAASSIGQHRWRFLRQSLDDLQSALAGLGQQLLVIHGTPLATIPQLITVFDIDAIFQSQNAGYYENTAWQTLQRRYPLINFDATATHTLFAEDTLPFPISELPATFSKFRKRVEPLGPVEPIEAVQSLPPQPARVSISSAELPPLQPGYESPFCGGAERANQHLTEYFSADLPAQYKQVRNQLEGWQQSTKFSPWLANGSLSIRQLVNAVRTYEARFGANESTYWIVFELLWREYFQWYAHCHGARLFTYRGIKQQNPLTSCYPERFQRWCNGSTPFPLVNACMKQLNASGYMSNRGRQIVASCLVNELSLDWRFGAAYFEMQLIDYDVASNWGNWQYLAGVGSDPRGKRHFNLDKQASLYDPDAAFTDRWQGNTSATWLDSVDAADWPLG